MKKFLSLSSIVKYIGVILLLITFFFVFSNQLHLVLVESVEDSVESVEKLADISASTMFGGGKINLPPEISLKGHGLSLAGYILVLLSALGVIAVSFIPMGEQKRKYITLILGLVALVSAILLFVGVRAYYDANSSALEILHSEVEEIVDGESVIHSFDGNFELSEGPATLGVLAIVGSIAVGCSEFLSKRSLIK